MSQEKSPVRKSVLPDSKNGISNGVDRFQKIAGSIHTHSNFSGTRFSPYQVAVLALRKRLKVLIFTDYSDREWKYRWGIRLRMPSILSKGAENYLSAVKYVDEKMEGMIILAGVEASPFYYWQGNPFKLTCRDYNRHILLFGLESAADYENLPLLANRKSGFNPFSGAQGTKPYQKLIDYAESKGALSFWAHPEQEDNTKLLSARLYTPADLKILEQTDNYTGFSAFPRGGSIVSQPGGVWDRLLSDYCGGKRTRPVWAIGESDFRKERDDIANPATVFIDPVENKKDVLNALKEGRIYALDSPGKEIFLNYFGLKDKETGKSASMGQTLSTGSGAVTVIVDIESEFTLKKVTLVKNGEVIKEIGQKQFEFTDNTPSSPKTLFYRLMAETTIGDKLLTNPVFLGPAEGKKEGIF